MKSDLELDGIDPNAPPSEREQIEEKNQKDSTLGLAILGIGIALVMVLVAIIKRKLC
jgi:hypothetical protein